MKYVVELSKSEIMCIKNSIEFRLLTDLRIKKNSKSYKLLENTSERLCSFCNIYKIEKSSENVSEDLSTS